MFELVNKYIIRIGEYLKLPTNRGNGETPIVGVDTYREWIKAEIHRIRLDATLAQLGAELPVGVCGDNGHRYEDRMQADLLFAQADRLERKLRYGSVR